MAGIYIRKILAGSPAEELGQISVGDRLLCVNGKSIVGADYQRYEEHPYVVSIFIINN